MMEFLAGMFWKEIRLDFHLHSSCWRDRWEPERTRILRPKKTKLMNLFSFQFLSFFKTYDFRKLRIKLGQIQCKNCLKSASLTFKSGSTCWVDSSTSPRQFSLHEDAISSRYKINTPCNKSDDIFAIFKVSFDFTSIKLSLRSQATFPSSLISFNSRWKTANSNFLFAQL